MDAGHLKESEEETFIAQAEKILRSAATSDKTKTVPLGDQTMETKPGKTEPQVTTESGISRASPPTVAKTTKNSSAVKQSMSTTASADDRSDLTVTAGTSSTGRQSTPVVNEVTGEVLPAEPTAAAAQGREPERERERDRSPITTTELIQRPLTRDVATGMSPAASSGLVLGSQSGREEGSGGKPLPLSLSTQNSNEVPVYMYIYMYMYMHVPINVHVHVYKTTSKATQHDTTTTPCIYTCTCKAIILI